MWQIFQWKTSEIFNTENKYFGLHKDYEHQTNMTSWKLRVNINNVRFSMLCIFAFVISVSVT